MEKQIFEQGAGKPRPVYQSTALTCKNCGAPIELYSERTQLITCTSCEMLLDCTTAEQIALGKNPSAHRFSLSLGQEFTWDDVKYKVIGSIRTKNSWGEYTESHLLFHPFNGIRWFARYVNENHSINYFVSKRTRVIPRDDLFSQFQGTRVYTDDGKEWKQKEGYTETIIEIAGALPWVAKVGDVSNVRELACASQSRLLLEAKQSQESKEIEYFLTLRISMRQFYAAIGKESGSWNSEDFSSASDWLNTFQNLNKDQRKVLKIAFIIVFVILFLMIDECSGGSYSGGSYGSRSYSGGGFSGGK